MVFSRNPEREARLLEEWVKGTTAREAATKTGTPEGTTYYYYKKFNKDPQNANRLAANLKPSRKLSSVSVLIQSAKIQNAQEAQRKFGELMREGKYAQADYYVKAWSAGQRLWAESIRDVNSFLAYFLADPKAHSPLAPQAAEEMIQMLMDQGLTFLDAAAMIERGLAAILLTGPTKEGGSLLMSAIADLKNRYLFKQKQEAKQKEAKSEATGPEVIHSISELPQSPKEQRGVPRSPKRMDWPEALLASARKTTLELEKMQREGEDVVIRPIVFLEKPSPSPDSGAVKQGTGEARLADVHGPPPSERPEPSVTAGQRRTRRRLRPVKTNSGKTSRIEA